MKDEDVIQDLKQFIAATVSQQTASLATKDDVDQITGDINNMKVDIKNLDDKLGNKIDDLSTSVAEVLETTVESIDEVHAHEQRIIKLEQRSPNA